MRYGVLVTCLLATALAPSCAAGQEQRFPFAIPWNDATHSAVDVSSLNPAPLDESRRIAVRDGHFCDATGRRVRFVGTNLAAGACFPRKEDAEPVAAHLHKLGLNCVRLHHMDSGWAEPNMFHLSGGSYGKRTDQLDPESLDRFDYLIYQLKQHGIYVDLNLHVGRAFSELDGLPDTDKLPDMGKVVSYFEPTIIARQQLYAEQLLTHYNPYTKTRYAEEPTVAMIELTNEDSLLDSADSIPGLPPHYRNLLAAGWNRYLKAKHGSTAKLLKAWNAEAVPLGANLLKNPRFEEGTVAWNLEQHEAARAEMTVEPIPAGAGAPPGKALRLAKLQLDKVGWHLQFTQPGLSLSEGQRYTLSFAARAGADRSLAVSVMLDQDPWRNVGMAAKASLTPRWQRYDHTFVARGVVPQHIRINFGFGDEEPGFELADLSLRPGGGGVALASGESIEQGSMMLPPLSDSPRGWDFAAYLIQVESDFSQGMRDYIHKTLGSKAPVACTQASYGGIGGAWRESQLDWVDMHAYWQHPWFPNRPWDSDDYRIGNTPMVREAGGGTLFDLASYRVAGKPFTVSEYDHPAPSEYAAEMVPMIFSYAAWQDWDGVFLFAYNGDDTDWDRDRIEGFFDQEAHPGKLAFVPSAAELFLRGYLMPAPERQTLLVPRPRLSELVAGGGVWRAWESAAAGHPLGFLSRRNALRFAPDGALQVERAGSPSGPSSPVSWQTQDPSQALFTVDSPCYKAVAGFPGGRAIRLGDVTLQVEPTLRGFVSMTLVSLDGRPLAESRSLLLTVADKVENVGLEWNADRTFAAHAWDRGPTMADPVTAEVNLGTKAAQASVYALDGAGRRTATVPCTISGGRLRFRTTPRDKTLWYEVETAGATP
jgi:hypothetical protein